MLACFRRGLFIQGLIHDWSKFLPSEWFPYAEYFYGIEYTDNDYRVMNQLGISYKSKQEIQSEFDKAWLYHQHFNPHHWQYWILKEDSGDTKYLDMPKKYLFEMLCDWEGAGLAITGKREYKEWYSKNKDKILVSEETRKLIEIYL